MSPANIFWYLGGLTVTFQLINCVSGESAWFQVCDKKKKFALNSLDCDAGLWLDEPMRMSCVCLYGIWVVSGDLCDSGSMIIAGVGNCFAIGRKVRSIKLLGDPEDPFAPVAYIGNEHFDSFVKVPASGYNNPMDTSSAVVISINPNQVLRRSDHELCLKLSDRFAHKPVHIFKNQRRATHRYRFVNETKCGTTERYHTHIGFGEIYQDGAIIPAEEVVQDCSRDCLTLPEIARTQGLKSLGKPSGRGLGGGSPKAKGRGRSTGIERSRSPTLIQWEGLYDMKKTLAFINGDSLNEAQKEHKKNIYRYRWNSTLPALGHARETREQSVRMIQAQTNFALLGQSTPIINTPEYDFLQKLRQVYLVNVASDLIPDSFVNALMRMFRLLLWESHDKFEHSEAPDIVQYGRIMRKLNECLYDVADSPILFVKEAEDDAEADDTGEGEKVNEEAQSAKDMKTNSTHGCLEQTTYAMWNRTKSNMNGAENGPKLDMVSQFTWVKDKYDDETPATWRVDKYDYVIEMAWKIYLFGFYRCSNYFNITANDQHQMAVKIQSLFTPPIIRRWTDPQGFNEVLKFVFPRVNFTQIAMVTDWMVKSAMEATYWQKIFARPSIYMDQEDLPHINIVKGLQRRKRGNKPSRKFSKPRSEPIKPKRIRNTDFWYKRAHCIQSYTDPIKVYHYHGDRGCSIPSAIKNS